MRYFVAFLLLSLCACGDNPPRRDTQRADTAPAGLELPTVGLLGALPPPQGRVTVVVDAAGALTIDGVSCPWGQLGRRLGEISATLGTRPLRAHMRAERVEEALEEEEEEIEEVFEQEIVAEEPVIQDEEVIEEVGTVLPAESWSPESLIAARTPMPRERAVFAPDGSRNADVLLRIDRRVPWSVVAHVLMVGCHPDRKLWRTFFAVNGTDGRGEGAVAVFLPNVAFCGWGRSPPEHVRVKLRSKRGAAEVAPGGLANDIRRRISTPETLLFVEIRGRRQTPYGDMLTAMDAALRAGAIGLGLEGHLPPEGDPVSWCAAARQAGPFYWEVSGQALRAGPALPAAGPHRSTAYAGLVNRHLFDALEELEEDVEDPVEEVEDK